VKKPKVDKFKLGLDWHGVADKYQAIFKMLAKIILNAGGEIHIVTGHSWNDKRFRKKFKKIWGDTGYNTIFSITDYLIGNGLSYKIDEKGGKCFELQRWNSAKAGYCLREGIHLMIDDSEDYGKYFTTPYLQLK
jgi:hypothetical protein